MQELVSVIIPIYNVEPYLEKCLQSVIDQTYTNLEIICINDQSQDDSIEIIKKFMLKDKRIILINNEKNLGLSVSRNIGIDACNGEYLVFVDSDDYIAKGFVEKTYEQISKKNIDLVLCSASLHDNLDNKIIAAEDYYTYKNLLKKKTLSKHFLLVDFGENSVTAWGKMWKSSIIKNNNIYFPEGINYEDNPFYFKYIIYVKNAYILNKNPLYYYRINRANSLKQDHLCYKDLIIAYNIIEKTIQKHNLYQYSTFIRNHKLQSLLFLAKKKSNRDYNFYKLLKLELDKISIDEVPTYLHKLFKRYKYHFKWHFFINFKFIKHEM